MTEDRGLSWHFPRTFWTANAIGIALMIIPFSALSVALAPKLGGASLSIASMSVHPVTLMLIVGIALQGLAECFLSPRFPEYASKQAPPGEVGIYMGYSHLTTVFAWLFAFALSGRLLDRWCPAPEVVAAMPAVEQAGAYAHAHYIWYVYTGIGVGAFVALMIFRFVTDAIDRRRA